MKRFGLIGYPLGHSFSQKYFTDKFQVLSLGDHSYDLFPMESVDEFNALWEDPSLMGINVTVPHKKNVMPLLDGLDASAEKVGAVNVIKREGDKLIGYNSDFYGFMISLKQWLDQPVSSALVLGAGGAAKAVEVALDELGIAYQLVSRDQQKGDLTYAEIKDNPQLLQGVDLIVNTTPLGMHPNVDGKPDLPYEVIHAEQYLYDLVYNPEETAFMKEGRMRGAKSKNGLEMLHLQADRAWEIWNE